MGFIYLLSLIVFLALKVPISFSLGATSLLFIVLRNPNLLLAMPQRIIPALDSNALLAIPMYILAGVLVVEAGLGTKMIRAINIIVGRVKGGLAHVNILVSLLFGGISASSVADTAALGSILIPTMVENGYPKSFATAVTVTSSPLSAIIPPSTLMIIYSSLTDASISKMFAAGIIPGILLALGLMGVSYYYSVKHNYGSYVEVLTSKEIFKAFVDVIPALLMPVIIVGGILGGIFTATESASVAVVYGFLISTFWYRDLSAEKVLKTLKLTVRLTATVGFIIAMASLFGWVMTIEKIPARVTEVLLGLSGSPIFFLLIVNIVFVFLGMFLNAATNMVMIIPLIMPAAQAYGIDPIHLGMIIVFNMGLGAVTPPVGTCLLTGCRVGNISMEEMIRPLLPFMGIMIVILLLVTYIPGISLMIPQAIYGK